MLFLTAPASQGDPVALVMVLVLAVIVAVMAWQKRLSRERKKKNKAASAAAAPVAAPQAPAPTAPGSAGKLKLHDVEPKTAAMVMAIVADKLGKPLNELRFISIKEVM